MVRICCASADRRDRLEMNRDLMRRRQAICVDRMCSRKKIGGLVQPAPQWFDGIQIKSVGPVIRPFPQAAMRQFAALPAQLRCRQVESSSRHGNQADFRRRPTSRSPSPPRASTPMVVGSGTGAGVWTSILAIFTTEPVGTSPFRMIPKFR